MISSSSVSSSSTSSDLVFTPLSISGLQFWIDGDTGIADLINLDNYLSTKYSI